MPTTPTTRIIPGALWDNAGMVRNAKHPSFGAKGDGVTDDTAAIQACLTASLTKGDVCVIPPADYYVSGPLIPAGSNAFINSSKQRVIMHGARFFSHDATPGRPIFKLNAFIGQEGTLTLEGGTLDGAATLSGSYGTVHGVEIHCNNVKLDRTVIRNCDKGITYVNDLAGPPICSVIDSCQVQLNRIGLHSIVPSSNLVLVGNRIEGNGEEGVYLDGCGKVCIVGNTIENNGFITATKNNLYVRNAVDGFISGNYFESTAGQIHTSVAFEGITLSVNAIVFTGNRIVNGSSTGAAGSIGLDIGANSGAIEGVVAFGNEYVGQTTAVRIGSGAKGCVVGPDYFSDNFAVGTAWSSVTAYVAGNIVSLNGVSYVCILGNTNQTPPNATYWNVMSRYNIISTAANQVNDFNRFAAIVYNTATLNAALVNTMTASGRITAAGGMQITGGTQASGTLTKDATLGILFRLAGGAATSDFTITDNGGNAIVEVPTGTKVWQLFANQQLKTVAITYAASMTPDASAGTLQTITATNGTAFTINAPTSPRAGETLRLRIRNTSGGALGAATFNAVFKMGAAWTQPATGFSRSIDFDYDGTNWVESYRSPTDVAN